MVLSILSIWSARSSNTDVKLTKSRKGRDESVDVSVKPVGGDIGNSGAKDNVDAAGVSAPIGVEEPIATPVETTTEPLAASKDPTTDPAEPKERPAPVQQRFSFRSFRFFRGSKVIVPHEQDATERRKAKAAAHHKKLSKLTFSADKRTQKDALAVQRLIVGSGAIKPTNAKGRPAPVSNAQMTRIRSELMKPKAANKLIAKLRALPEPVEPSDEGSSNEPKLLAAASASVAPRKSSPIHAVCLECTEADVQTKHFSKLKEHSVISAGIESLISLFSELHVIDLLAAPDLGFGQPAGGNGLLAGAVPTAETIIQGASMITPQLMALGYATGKAVFPDHSEIYPPTDRMSVLTYWWGLELCLPPPTLAHLSQAPNIAHQVVNFLTAMSLMSNGVREVLPFVRYIGQFIDFQWGAIERQDKGKGVVCAATWIMPAAMVPRPWDFPDPPAKDDKPEVEQPHEPEVTPTPAPNGPLPPTLIITPPSVFKSASPHQDT